MCASDAIFNKLIWQIDEVCYYTGYAKGTIYNFVSKVKYHTDEDAKESSFSYP